MRPNEEAWYRLGRIEGILSLTDLKDLTSEMRAELKTALDAIDELETRTPKWTYIIDSKEFVCRCGAHHHCDARVELPDDMGGRIRVDCE